MNSKEPLVSIICTAYNHEQFIAQAMDGFLIQKTTFPFEIIVSDDASTDKTASIIHEYEKNYPELFKVFYHQENQYSRHIPFFYNELVESSKGKYIALCEGDDYWTDPLKLQKQVDFLEANPDYGLVHTDYYKFHQRIAKYERQSVPKVRHVHNKYDYDELLKANGIQTLTVCLRRDTLIQYFKDIKPEEKPWLLGDYPIWLYFALFSKTNYLPEKMAVYRMLENSASSRKDRTKGLKALSSIYEVKKHFIKMYGCKNETKELLENEYIQSIIRMKINVGYDLRDQSIIEETITEKRRNNISVTLVDRIKLFSASTFLIWKVSRIAYSIKKQLSRYSPKYVSQRS